MFAVAILIFFDWLMQSLAWSCWCLH